MDRTALRQVLAEELQRDTGQVHEDLNDGLNLREGLGLDSIGLVTLVVNLQGRFGIELTAEELEKIVKVGELLDLLQVKLPAARSAA